MRIRRCGLSTGCLPDCYCFVPSTRHINLVLAGLVPLAFCSSARIALLPGELKSEVLFLLSAEATSSDIGRSGYTRPYSDGIGERIYSPHCRKVRIEVRSGPVTHFVETNFSVQCQRRRGGIFLNESPSDPLPESKGISLLQDWLDHHEAWEPVPRHGEERPECRDARVARSYSTTWRRRFFSRR
jgi:hypothetical protein